MTEQSKTPITNKGFNSAWNPTLEEFKRFQFLLISFDRISLEVKLNKIKAIRPYYAILYQLSINLRPLMNKDERDDIFKNLKELDQKLNKWEKKKVEYKFPASLVKEMDDFAMKVQDIKQKRGFGVSVSKESDRKKDGEGLIANL